MARERAALINNANVVSTITSFPSGNGTCNITVDFPDAVPFGTRPTFNAGALEPVKSIRVPSAKALSISGHRETGKSVLMLNVGIVDSFVEVVGPVGLEPTTVRL